jgi:hypothetical protein
MQPDPEQTRQRRGLQRRIEAHRRQWHLFVGGEVAQNGLIDILTHINADGKIEGRGLIVPRSGLAMVPPQHIEAGLTALQKLGVQAAIMFIDELYPAFFHKMLVKMGLTRIEGAQLLARDISPAPTLPAGWRVAWRQVDASATAPANDDAPSKDLDLHLYFEGEPLTANTLLCSGGCAELSYPDYVMNVPAKPDSWPICLLAVQAAAYAAGCDMLYMQLEQDLLRLRPNLLSVGFVDLGRIVYYVPTQPQSSTNE